MVFQAVQFCVCHLWTQENWQANSEVHPYSWHSHTQDSLLPRALVPQVLQMKYRSKPKIISPPAPQANRICSDSTPILPQIREDKKQGLHPALLTLQTCGDLLGSGQLGRSGWLPSRVPTGLPGDSLSSSYLGVSPHQVSTQHWNYPC